MLRDISPFFCFLADRVSFCHNTFILTSVRIVFHPWVVPSFSPCTALWVSLHINVTIKNCVISDCIICNCHIMLKCFSYNAYSPSHSVIRHTRNQTRAISKRQRGKKTKKTWPTKERGNFRSHSHPRDEASFLQKAPSKDSPECFISLWCLSVMRYKPWWQ